MGLITIPLRKKTRLGSEYCNKAEKTNAYIPNPLIANMIAKTSANEELITSTIAISLKLRFFCSIVLY